MNAQMMMSLVPLLGKELSALTTADLTKAAQAFGITVDMTNELHQGALALLQGENIHRVAELIQNPSAIAKLMSFFQPPAPTEMVKQCPHCKNFATQSLSNLIVTCPHCRNTFLLRSYEDSEALISQSENHEQ